MPEKKVQTEAGPDTTALLERIAALESQLELVKFASEDLQKKKQADPANLWKEARERVAKSMAPKGGSVTWKVTVPGAFLPVTFSCDTENEQAAIREFETRFGTRFITSSQRDDGNHKIEKVAT